MFQTLDRRGVDLFFGVGLPVVGQRYCTTTHLERTSGWILVYRTLDNAIYIRADDRDRENLTRVASYYANLGIPFDPEAGIDPFRVIQARPDWAAAHGMIPPDHDQTVAASQSTDRNVQLRDLDQLGSTYALLGAYPELIEVETEAQGLGQRGKLSQRRLIYGLIRLDRVEEAVDAAKVLLNLDPQDAHPKAFVSAANRRASTATDSIQDQVTPDRAEPSFIETPPLFTREEFIRCCADYP